MKKEMIEKAAAVMHNANAPYSHFQVGACLRAENDQLFVGCNVENISYSLTLCAESSAIGALISSGCKSIKEVVVIGSCDDFCSPCGACRQRIFELAQHPDIPIHMCNKNKQCKTVPLSELLPYAFKLDHENEKTEDK